MANRGKTNSETIRPIPIPIAKVSRRTKMNVDGRLVWLTMVAKNIELINKAIFRVWTYSIIEFYVRNFKIITSNCQDIRTCEHLYEITSDETNNIDSAAR